MVSLTTSLDPKTVILLDAAKGGDQAAWDDLHRRYRGYLHYVVKMRLAGTPGGDFGTEDVLQEAFVRAWRNLDAFEYRGEGSLLAWLTRIVVRQVANHTRGKRLEAQGLETSALKGDLPAAAAETPSEELIQAESHDRLRRAFERLTDEEQMILGLRFGQSLTWKEIGEILDVHRAAAAKSFARAVERMRRFAEDPEAEG